MAEKGGKRPIDIIRKMNPGVDIPTGAEMAKRIRDREEKEEALQNKDSK